MKKGTKLLIGLGLAGFGGYQIWANRSNVQLTRMAPPGYVQQRYLVDSAGRQWAVQFIYPTVGGKTVTYVVPIDPSKRGYPGVLEQSRVPL